ncbi:hypothetical protein CRUP_010100 [Coryphaenoides rupestris]|nr:hypothetical protein CRUP_010100 [Coryphaenoides rupestris]
MYYPAAGRDERHAARGLAATSASRVRRASALAYALRAAVTGAPKRTRAASGDLVCTQKYRGERPGRRTGPREPRQTRKYPDARRPSGGAPRAGGRARGRRASAARREGAQGASAAGTRSEIRRRTSTATAPSRAGPRLPADHRSARGEYLSRPAGPASRRTDQAQHTRQRPNSGDAGRSP